MRSRISKAVLLFAILGGSQLVRPQNKGSFNGFDLVDKTGKISKPNDYRDHYQALGTYTVLDPKGNEMHYTYASPGTAEYYRKNGTFPDGAVLVKDEKGRFPGNPLWGSGWGWALYKSDAPDKQVAVDYQKDCIGCHLPAKATDWVYVQGYPVLSSK